MLKHKMTKENKDQVTHLQVRLPTWLKSEVEERANDELMSVSAFTRRALMKQVKTEVNS
jgi:hypothetical protein